MNYRETNMPPLRIANGAGFLGDWIDAPRRLVERAEVDYLTIEHLAELTMSILARQREKDPNAGYAEDFLDIVCRLIPALKRQSQLKIIANSGGMHPRACARAVAKILLDAGFGDLTIGCANGDDLLPRLPELLSAGCEFANFDTGQRLSELLRNTAGQASSATPQPPFIVSANAYLGARSIA